MSDMVGKWGKEVAERGFAQVPNYLLLINQFLIEEKRLRPEELMILVHLVGAWWRTGEMPYPSLKTLATRSGVSDRQAQRAVSRLEGLGFIQRVKRKNGSLIASNAYDLKPLVSFLGHVAKAFPNEFVRKVPTDELNKLDATLGQREASPEIKEDQKPAPKRLRLPQHRKRALRLDAE